MCLPLQRCRVSSVWLGRSKWLRKRERLLLPVSDSVVPVCLRLRSLRSGFECFTAMSWPERFSPMQFELLRVIIGLLDDAGIAHMVTGSFASTFHGEPRMTRDIDLVVDPTEESMGVLVEMIDRDRFYIGDAVSAARHRDMVNVIDNSTGWKVDLIIRKDRPFSETEFARRVPVELGGVRVFVASVEDTVLAKLEWANASGSERQIRDVEAMLRVQTPDWDYLDRWAPELGVVDLLAKARGSSELNGS